MGVSVSPGRAARPQVGLVWASWSPDGADSAPNGALKPPDSRNAYDFQRRKHPLDAICDQATEGKILNDTLLKTTIHKIESFVTEMQNNEVVMAAVY